MEQTLGITPKHDASITSSKICGSCHTVVLPVLDTGGAPWTPPGYTHPRMAVEQGTYVEWVFSAFHDDGAEPRSCQNCHMPKTYPGLKDELAFRIASIQQASSFPETEHRRTRAEIDLPIRQGFARHTLAGLNAFLIPLASLPGKPASVKATLYYQAIPPFYLQDRFCITGNQPDTQRLYAMAGYLQLDGTRAAHWKLALVSSGVVSLTQ